METPARLNDLQRTTLAIVLAGGRGTRLGPLTNKRVKPAVHFGGKYRIIDFALSNCLNSGIRRIAVVTQYKAHSLLRHLQRGWGFLRGEFGEFIDLWPAQQRVEGAHWYRGTADAVFQPRHHPLDPAEVRGGASGRPYLQDGLHAHARGSCGKRRGLHGRLHRGAAHGRCGLRRDACG